MALAGAGWSTLSWVFLGLASAGYLELLVVEGIPVLRRPHALLETFGDIRGALGAFPFGVATLVLASRFAGLGYTQLAVGLFVVGGMAALGCVYLVPATLFWRPHQAGRLRRGGGLWLLWPVALLAVSVAASTIARSGGFEPGPLTVLAAAIWALGLAIYLPLLAALMGGLVLSDIRLRDVGPSYWITMGGSALACLAASLILADPSTVPLVGAGFAAVAGALALWLWFLATALLPVVIGLTLVRSQHRDQLTGAPKELWVVVFPAGMYALASRTLGLSSGHPWLVRLGGAAVWLAVAVFLIEVGRAVLMRLLPAG